MYKLYNRPCVALSFLFKRKITAPILCCLQPVTLMLATACSFMCMMNQEVQKYIREVLLYIVAFITNLFESAM